MKPFFVPGYAGYLFVILFLLTLCPYAGVTAPSRQAALMVATMADATPGLDARPLDATCIAPARPSVATRVALERAFPNLVVSDVVAMLQAPGDTSR